MAGTRCVLAAVHLKQILDECTFMTAFLELESAAENMTARMDYLGTSKSKLSKT